MTGRGERAGPGPGQPQGKQFRGREATPGLVSARRAAAEWPQPLELGWRFSPGSGDPKVSSLGLLGGAPAWDSGGAEDPGAQTQSSFCWRPSISTWTSSVSSSPGDPVLAGGWTA